MNNPPGFQLRNAAYEILNDYEKTGTYLHVLFKRYIHGFDPRDQKLVRQICYGITRWKLLLDYNISLYTKKKKIKPPLLACLRITAFQILFLDRVPPYAASDTGVHLIKKNSGPVAAGFGNAIFKKLIKGGLVYKKGNSTEAISTNTSHPVKLVERIRRQTDDKKLMHILNANNLADRNWIRVNTQKKDPESINRELENLQPLSTATPGFPFVLLKSGYHAILGSDSFKAGHISIQDPASWYVARLVNYRSPQKILDLCCAPGGKSALMCEMYGIDTPVICSDISPKRILKMNDVKNRLGHKKLLALSMDARYPALKNRYDIILADAPCSNLGVIARRPEIKWRFSEADLPAICSLQKDILNHADPLLEKSGALIYSTCSPDIAETYEVVNTFMNNHKNYRLDDAAGYIPEKYVHRGCLNILPGDTEFDGFFAARLIKITG